MALAEVFRTEWPRVVATLVRDFGDLDLAEECTQEAFIEASERWANGVEPDRPGAWLTTTARRKAIDRLRRSANYEQKLREHASFDTGDGIESTGAAHRGLVDEQLALLLGCCHPALNLDAQVALTLRIVAGLTTEQIARAFLVERETMAKRLSRAKKKIRQANIAFDPVDRTVLDERVEAVRHVIYLIFTEGHASAGDQMFVRGDLCEESIWLASLLAELRAEDGEAQALLALILLTDARRATRLDDDGVPLRLENQDRARWDRRKINQGLNALARGVALGPLGRLGLQATVAAFHAAAPSFADTAWKQILATYDRMLALAPSPVIALNRAAALSYAESPEVALASVDALAETLSHYLYFHTARADLLRRLGRSSEARRAYERAETCATGSAERAFIERELALLDHGDPDALLL